MVSGPGPGSCPAEITQDSVVSFPKIKELHQGGKGRWRWAREAGRTFMSSDFLSLGQGRSKGTKGQAIVEGGWLGRALSGGHLGGEGQAGNTGPQPHTGACRGWHWGVCSSQQCGGCRHLSWQSSIYPPRPALKWCLKPVCQRVREATPGRPQTQREASRAAWCDSPGAEGCWWSWNTHRAPQDGAAQARGPGASMHNGTSVFTLPFELSMLGKTLSYLTVCVCGFF